MLVTRIRTGLKLSQKRAAYAALSTTSGLTAELGTSLVRRLAGQLLFDAKQLVVLGNAVRAAQRASLDLTSGSAHGEVGDGVVFGFAAAVRDHRGVAGGLGHLDGFQGLGQRADLVELDQDRVADALLDTFLEDAGVGHEQVV